MINQKWVTDVSEFKYGVGEDDKKGKLYLSVILDLCDRRPVAFVYSTRNDNPLVFDTFDKAVAANPGLHHYFIVIEAISILRKHLGGEF